jgi:hypothetical protein
MQCLSVYGGFMSDCNLGQDVTHNRLEAPVHLQRVTSECHLPALVTGAQHVTASRYVQDVQLPAPCVMYAWPNCGPRCDLSILRSRTLPFSAGSHIQGVMP